MPNTYNLPDTYANPYGTKPNSQQSPYAAPKAPGNSPRSTGVAQTMQQASADDSSTPPPASTGTGTTTTNNDPVSTLGSWVDRGWVDEDGMVTLPWGVKVPVKEAIAMYYADKPPTADEVPPWIRMNVANEFTPTYWNQLPSQMRPFVQNLYDTARQASGASRTQYPTVASMTPQAQYYG